MKVSEAMTETVPTEPGFYWARCSKHDPWEPVELTADTIVYAIGFDDPFSRDAFTWGPRITMPEGLGEGE